MSQTKPAASEPSEIAGRYQVVKKLGAGAFGTVYKAKDRILGRMVAIKTIRLEGLAAAGASLDELMERFKREAQVSAQLKHPNIVTIYDIGDAEGVSYLAMEFIDGVGLDRVIAGAGRLPVERAASIGVQIADALDFAHKHGVVHRDIKPANIMIEAGDRVKVTDFGIAKVTTSGEHLTMTGSLLGTPSYMSPEQARGGQLDGRSDLFAVGCILYEMFVGQKAFRGDSITGLIFKIITEEPQPIHALDPDVPDEMIRIIAKALSKAPETRYQSGRELADDLGAFTRAGSTPTVRQGEMPTAPGLPAASGTGLGAPPTVQAPPTVAGAAPTHVGGTPTQVAASPTAVAPPARVAPPPRPAPPPAAARAAAAPRKSGSGAGLLIGLGLAGILFLSAGAVGGWYFFLRKPAGGDKVAGRTSDAGTTTSGAATSDAGTSGSTSAGPASPAPGSTEPASATSSTDTGASQGAASSSASSTGAATHDTSTQTPSHEHAGTAGLANPGTGTTIARDTTRPPTAGSGRSVARPPDAGTPTEPATSAAERSFLDEEPAENVDGAAAGERLAQSYRSDQGSRSTSFGTGARFKAREHSPRNLALAERPAVAALRHVINAEEMYHKKHGRYGSLADLASARTLFLDVPVQATAFARKNYRFELTVEEDGFKVVAMPTSAGPRPFIGDDSGFIRAGVE